MSKIQKHLNLKNIGANQKTLNNHNVNLFQNGGAGSTPTGQDLNYFDDNLQSSRIEHKDVDGSLELNINHGSEAILVQEKGVDNKLYQIDIIQEEKDDGLIDESLEFYNPSMQSLQNQ